MILEVPIVFSRVWAMPTPDTFDIPEIRGFVQKYLIKSQISVDCFSRNKRWTTYTNDLNPNTAAEHHMDAEDFLMMLASKGIRCDLAILDPPYSPRQISECYHEAGMNVGMKETQNAAFYSRVKNATLALLNPEAIVLSFGWNTNGMGKKHGFEIVEILIVAHGSAHNDTLCMAEKRITVEPCA